MLALTYRPIFAHFGHWYVSVPTFMTPVVILAVCVKVSERRALRRAREGDTSRLPVLVTEQDDRTTVAVQGSVNYLTLLDIEHELGAAVARDLPILLDLREAEPAEDEFAWSITEVLRSTEDADITVLAGSAPAFDELRKICALEGVRILEEIGFQEMFRSPVPASANAEESPSPPVDRRPAGGRLR
jgi:hypothetical protein